MVGGLFNTVARSALLAAAGVVLVGAASAQAADLGGNCCADLEERVAELEATTARKGNRKVSLTVYGQVNEAVLFWDDGGESNVGVYTNDNARTRFGFKGDAKIADGWKAGYVLEIGVRGANSKRFNQDNPTSAAATDIGLDVRHSRWFINSKTYGTISTGVTPTALEGATEVNLAASKDVAKFSDVEDLGLGLNLRRKGRAPGAIAWRRLISDDGDQPGEGERRPGIWYVSPEFAGFSFEAGWGADDHWDVGGNYKGEVGDFKLAAKVAYGENTGTDTTFSNFFDCQSANPNLTGCKTYGGSISILHSPTGIYANLAGGKIENNEIQTAAGAAVPNADDTSTFWAVEAGIERKFNSLGKTTLFAQYYDFDGGTDALRSNVNATTLATNGAETILATGLQAYGVGAIQELAAASTSLYVFYRHYEADLTLSASGKVTDLENLDVVVGGAIIKF